MTAPLAACAAATLLAAAPALSQPAPQRASAERPILLVAQLVSGPLDDSLKPRLQPLDTMQEVEAFLQANGVAYNRRRLQIDTRTADKRLVTAIADLPPDEIFVIPQDGNLLFNQVIRALSEKDAALVENW
jgi:hypothetical protein